MPKYSFTDYKKAKVLHKENNRLKIMNKFKMILEIHQFSYKIQPPYIMNNK